MVTAPDVSPNVCVPVAVAVLDVKLVKYPPATASQPKFLVLVTTTVSTADDTMEAQ
jgi:hypothetical protein